MVYWSTDLQIYSGAHVWGRSLFLSATLTCEQKWSVDQLTLEEKACFHQSNTGTYGRGVMWPSSSTRFSWASERLLHPFINYLPRASTPTSIPSINSKREKGVGGVGFYFPACPGWRQSCCNHPQGRGISESEGSEWREEMRKRQLSDRNDKRKTLHIHLLPPSLRWTPRVW